MEVFELSKKIPALQNLRVLENIRFFFEGLAAFCLARQTHQPKWRVVGEEAANKLLKLELVLKWNFEHKSKLLQAERCYLDGELESAEAAYQASIKSALEHKFIHEAALAYELYGIFCIENNMVDEGRKQLQMAVDKYKQWGAMQKVAEVLSFMELVSPLH